MAPKSRMNLQSKYDRAKPAPQLSAELLTQVLSEFLGRKKVQGVLPLSGGYSTINYKLDLQSNARAVVLKIIQKPQAVVEVELDVMRLASGKVPVPQVIYHEFNNADLRAHLVVMEFIEGVMIDDLSTVTDQQCKKMAQTLGRELAQIHSIQFDQSGYFGPGPTIANPFKAFSESCLESFNQILDSPITKQRLGMSLYTAVRDLVDFNWGLVASLAPVNSLVHSDFNIKNIIFASSSCSEISAVLDWEFAFAGHPYVDIGNFLRFDDELPEGMEHVFLEAYQQTLGRRLTGYKRPAKLLDLLALLDFVVRKDPKSQTFATAKNSIEKTLLRWDSFAD